MISRSFSPNTCPLDYYRRLSYPRLTTSLVGNVNSRLTSNVIGQHRCKALIYKLRITSSYLQNVPLVTICATAMNQKDMATGRFDGTYDNSESILSLDKSLGDSQVLSALEKGEMETSTSSPETEKVALSQRRKWSLLMIFSLSMMVDGTNLEVSCVSPWLT